MFTARKLSIFLFPLKIEKFFGAFGRSVKDKQRNWPTFTGSYVNGKERMNRLIQKIVEQYHHQLLSLGSVKRV